jgi:hypothetical protein
MKKNTCKDGTMASFKGFAKDKKNNEEEHVIYASNLESRPTHHMDNYLRAIISLNFDTSNKQFLKNSKFPKII